MKIIDENISGLPDATVQNPEIFFRNPERFLASF
jgi:hypothetical protein